MWHFLVRVWRRHWLDDTTQFTCIRNRLKINTEPQDVCTRKWIADVGSHTFLGQTFDNRKWWPDFVFTVSKWASLKRGLEIVLKQLGRQKRGTFMGHLWTRGWDWDGCKCHKCQIVSHSCFQLTLSHQMWQEAQYYRDNLVIQAICGQFWTCRKYCEWSSVVAWLTGLLMVGACGVKGPRAAHTCALAVACLSLSAHLIPV